MTVKFHKAVAALPNTLEPDAVYAVRTGEGFDLHIADSTGTVAHKANGGTGGEGTSLPTGTTGQILTVDGNGNVTFKKINIDNFDMPENAYPLFALHQRNGGIDKTYSVVVSDSTWDKASEIGVDYVVPAFWESDGKSRLSSDSNYSDETDAFVLTVSDVGYSANGVMTWNRSNTGIVGYNTGGTITSYADATAPNHVVRKSQLDAAIASVGTGGSGGSTGISPADHAAGASPFAFVPGAYYDGAMAADNNITMSANVNRLTLQPTYFSRPLTFDQLGCVVSAVAAAGNWAQACIFSAHPDTGWPDQLLVSTGQIDISVAGYRMETVAPSFTLPGNAFYWLGMRVHGTTGTLAAYTRAATFTLGRASASDYSFAMSRAITSDAELPTTWSFNAAERARNTNIPVVVMRAS